MALDAQNRLPIDRVNDTRISDAVASLYGFNLGFALEGRVKKGDIWANVAQIKQDVIGLLVENIARAIDETSPDKNERIIQARTEMSSLVEELLDNETLQVLAQPFEQYKIDVERRATSPQNNFSEKL